LLVLFVIIDDVILDFYCALSRSWFFWFSFLYKSTSNCGI